MEGPARVRACRLADLARGRPRLEVEVQKQLRPRLPPFTATVATAERACNVANVPERAVVYVLDAGDTRVLEIETPGSTAQNKQSKQNKEGVTIKLASASMPPSHGSRRPSTR